jgi:hypothetical protein
MIPLIGLIISVYTLTRFVDMTLDKRRSWLVNVASAISFVITIILVAQLLTAGTPSGY